MLSFVNDLSRHNLFFGAPERKELVNHGNAFPVLKSFLAELWRQTRPGEALPGIVAERG